MMANGDLVLAVVVLLVNGCTSYDMMFVSTMLTIRYFNLSEVDGHGTYIPLTNVSQLGAVDYDPTEEYVYWADKNQAVIARAKLNGSDQTVLKHVGNPTSVAIDVSSRMIYWTDSDRKTIERSYLNGTGWKVVLDEYIQRPSAIVVDAKNGKMYWADSGNNAHIERANFDGTQREIIVETSSYQPVLLSLDLENERMYWSDGLQDSIVAFDRKGGNVELLSQDITPSALDSRGTDVYWSAMEKNVSKIFKYDNSKGSGKAGVVLSLANWNFYGLKAAQTKEGKRILLVAQNSGIMELDLDVERDLGKQIMPLAEETLFAIDYDAEDDKIYWISSFKMLRRANRDGSNVEDLVKVNTKSAAGLGFDKGANMVFWTEYYKKRIRKVNLSEGKRMSLVVGYFVLTLTLDRKNKFVYYVDSEVTSGTIKRVTYDGQNSEVLVTNLQLPTSVVLDVPNNRLYWSQYDFSRIGVATLDGNTLNGIESENKILCLTKLGDSLFWFSLNRHVAQKNLKTETGWSILRQKKEKKFTSIKIIQGIGSCQSEPCQNGGTCVDEVTGYHCVCKAIYSGANCDINLAYLTLIVPFSVGVGLLVYFTWRKIRTSKKGILPEQNKMSQSSLGAPFYNPYDNAYFLPYRGRYFRDVSSLY